MNFILLLRAWLAELRILLSSHLFMGMVRCFLLLLEKKLSRRTCFIYTFSISFLFNSSTLEWQLYLSKLVEILLNHLLQNFANISKCFAKVCWLREKCIFCSYLNRLGYSSSCKLSWKLT